MDIDSEVELFTKKCYKCKQQLLDNLKIVYNSSNSKIVLWNKYQIFVYEDVEFESPEKTFIPEFRIHLVIVFNNFLVCLDCNGNLHITSLKFKNSTQMRLKIVFQPREQGIKTCIRFKDDHTVSLKYDSGTYFLCFNRINSEFQLEKSIILIYNYEHWPLEQGSIEKYLLTSYTINKDDFQHLNKIFKTDDIQNNLELIILSFDKLTVYGCLISPKLLEDEATLVKLYSCPAEICNVELVQSGELSLIIGLKMGTVIKLSLSDVSKTPNIVHLNTALYKMLALTESIIYTDGVTMWNSKNTFTNDIKLSQFFVRNINDFAKCGDQIVCTTFTKLIYKFYVEDKSAYQTPITSDEYCPAEKLLNNADYFNKLFEEIDKNNEQVKKLSREQDYLTALSLSNRQDVVEKAIESTVLVFESYEEAINLEFTLTEDIKEYFEGDTWLFLVKITNSKIYNALNNILSNLSDSIRIHLTISSSCRILKSMSLKVEKLLKTVNFLIPLNMKSVETEIIVNIKIVVKIPNALDGKQTSSVLYRKDIVILSEHFIKTRNNNTNKSLKKPKDSIEYSILKSASMQHGSLFKFVNISTLNESSTEWSYYVKLPSNYKTILTSNNYCNEYLNSSKSSCLVQQWSGKEFLESKNHIIFEINNEKVKISIHNDGFSDPMLKVTGSNAKMAFNIRNFFSNMIYNDYENCESGKEFINYTFYTTTENLQKAVKNCVKSSASFEEFLPLMDRFEKNIIGALPL